MQKRCRPSGIVWLILLPLVASQAWEPCQERFFEPCICVGINRTLKIDCSSRGLLLVPSPIPVTAEWLNFSGNRISVIPHGVFNDLNNLKELDLSSNDITRLDTDVFSGLQSLSYLNLNYNAIAYGEPGFANSSLNRLRQLERLYMLTDPCPLCFPDRIVDGLGMLKELAVYVPGEGSFGERSSSLKSLDTLYLKSDCAHRSLSRNDLKHLFSLPIRRLSLRAARLSHIDPDALQGFNRTLRKLDISCNYIDNVPEIIHGLRGIQLETFIAEKALKNFIPFKICDETLESLKSMNLTVLSLANNDLVSISVRNKSLHNLEPTNLQYLRLGYNQLIIDFDALSELLLSLVPFAYNLRVLDLSGLLNFYTSDNHIVDCDHPSILLSDQEPEWESDDIFFVPPEMPLWLWVLLAVRRFQDHAITLPPTLTRLYSRDVGKYFPSLDCAEPSFKFYAQNNLLVLDASGTVVKEIHCFTQGLLRLETVNASYMQLQRFNPYFFSNVTAPRLIRLDLSYNSLGAFFNQSITSPFKGTHQIKYLDLSNNHISLLPQDFLDQCQSLIGLNLSGNSLDQWNVSVSNVRNLQTLDLSDNQLSNIAKSSRDQFDEQQKHVNLIIILRNVTCSCKNYDFLVWTLLTQVDVRRSFTCNERGELQALPSIELLWMRCYYIYVVSCVCLILVCLILGMFFKWRLRYLYYKLKRFFWNIADSWRSCEDIRVYMAHHVEAGHAASLLQAFLMQRMHIQNVVTRDCFVVGMHEYDEIALHIDHSHFVVLLVSPEAPRDPKAEFELHMSLEKGTRFIFPILMADIASYNRLPRVVKKLLIMNNHVVWPSSLANVEYTNNFESLSDARCLLFFDVLQAYIQNLIRRLETSHAKQSLMCDPR